jgi:hypothetical protein
MFRVELYVHLILSNINLIWARRTVYTEYRETYIPIMTKTRNNNNDDNGDLDKVLVNEQPCNKKKNKTRYETDEFEENMLKEKRRKRAGIKIEDEKESNSSSKNTSDSTNERQGVKKPVKEVNMSGNDAGGVDSGDEESEISDSKTGTDRGELVASARLGRTSGTDTRDMSMTRGSKPTIIDNARLCAKRELFQMIKFVNPKIHSPFCMDKDSVAGFVVAFCNQGVTPTRDEANDMWDIARPVVFKSITHLRNNCIKAIQKEYMGEFVCLTCLVASGQQLTNTFINCCWHCTKTSSSTERAQMTTISKMRERKK